MLHTTQVGGTEHFLLRVGWGHRGEEGMEEVESVDMEKRTRHCRWARRTT